VYLLGSLDDDRAETELLLTINNARRALANLGRVTSLTFLSTVTRLVQGQLQTVCQRGKLAHFGDSIALQRRETPTEGKKKDV